MKMTLQILKFNSKVETHRFLYMSRTRHVWEGGGVGYSTNIYTGRFRPEVQSLILLYTIFHKKGTPFIYLLLTNGTPFTDLV